MTRKKPLDRLGANSAHQPDVKVNNGARSRAAANAVTPRPLWIRSLANYDRREAKTFAVSRFG